MIAVIPARGGSKGIPGKNYRRICGLPLIQHSLEACSLAGLRTVVSTDCYVVRGITLDFGAEVVDRPEEISGDTSPSEMAVLDAITQLGYDDSHVLMVQCTSPFTQPEDIQGVVNLLQLGYDSVFTACEFHGFIWEDGVPVGHSVGYRPMRQEMNQFLENGAVYGFETKGFLKHKHRFFGDIGMYEMSAERSFEIDGPHDLVIAEAMVEVLE